MVNKLNLLYWSAFFNILDDLFFQPFLKYDFFYLFPEFFFLIVLLLLLLLFGLDLFINDYFRERLLVLNNFISYLFCFSALLFSIHLYEYPPFPVEISNYITIDYYTQVSKFFLAILGFILLRFSAEYLCENKRILMEYPILVGFLFFFIMFLLNSSNFFFLYLNFEAISLILCILAGLDINSSTSLESSTKYFSLSSFASSLLLFGISSIFGINQGQYAFNSFFNISNFFFSTMGILVVILILSAFLFKIGGFPYSIWAPDVYEGLSGPILFLFVVFSKSAFILVLIKILHLSFFSFFNTYKFILLVSGLGSFLLGTLAAIPQTSIRRFIAYSSTGQVGFILLGLATGSQSGCVATLTFLFIYILNNLIFLGIVLTSKNPKTGKYLNTFQDLSLFCKINPSASWILVLSLFSFSGLPPLPGFFAKFLILRSLIDSYLLVPCILALLFSCVSAFYYIRFIKNLWFYFYTPLGVDNKTLYYNFNFYFFKQSKFNFVIIVSSILLLIFPFFLTEWYYFLSLCILKSGFIFN